MADPDVPPSSEPDPAVDGLQRLKVGGFRFWFVGQRWEWSDEVARMHGYEPGSVTPTTELLLSHKHPDDRRHVQDLLDHALHFDGSFSSRHRFLDTVGAEHTVIVLADRIVDDSGAVVGTEGYYVDLTQNLEQVRREAITDSLSDIFEARAAIEQAKGALMVVYGVEADQAFELLQWRSRHSNTKLRNLATQIVTELATTPFDTQALRRQFDHLLLTVHERAPGHRHG
ncbi:MAG: PAS and ANTAR domain-containing protein [Mycobacterium sp.]|nr:PAS and ANTAR domain-containing protein [Mycobacterium sp.]